MESLKRKIKNVPIYIIAGTLLIFIVIILEVTVSDKEQYHNTQCSKAAYEMMIENIPVFISTNKDNEEQKHNKERYFESITTCSDLAAQWRVAVVTERAYYIGLIGVFLIFITWIATREAVKVSRQSAMDELRAYISVEGVTAESISNGIKVIISIKNVGQTPAKNVTINRCFQLGSYENIIQTKPDHIKKIKASYGAIARDGVRTGNIEFTQTGLSEWSVTQKTIESGDKVVLIEGWVEYQDIYDREYVTFFRGYMTGVTAKNNLIQIANECNEMT